MVPQRQKGNKSLRCLMFLYLILVGDSVRACLFLCKKTVTLDATSEVCFLDDGSIKVLNDMVDAEEWIRRLFLSYHMFARQTDRQTPDINISEWFLLLKTKPSGLSLSAH